MCFLILLSDAERRKVQTRGLESLDAALSWRKDVKRVYDASLCNLSDFYQSWFAGFFIGLSLAVNAFGIRRADCRGRHDFYDYCRRNHLFQLFVGKVD